MKRKATIQKHIKWISVKDRLPGHGTNVLVLIESHESHDYVRFAHYKNGAFYEQDGSVIENIEYWRQNGCCL